MPVVVLPQFFLCGLLVPRDQMAGWLQAISDVLPLTYAVEALQEVGAHADADRPRCGGTSAIVAGARAARPGARGGDPAPEDELSEPGRPRRHGGRRPGNPDTREASSPRPARRSPSAASTAPRSAAIATAAGVDPALVHHYFGSKDQLFLAAVERRSTRPSCCPRCWPAAADAARRAAGPHASCGSGTRRPARPRLALLRSAVSNEWTARLLREFLVTQVLRRVCGHLDLDPAEAPLRGALVATQLIGLAMIRYVLRWSRSPRPPRTLWPPRSARRSSATSPPPSPDPTRSPARPVPPR